MWVVQVHRVEGRHWSRYTTVIEDSSYVRQVVIVDSSYVRPSSRRHIMVEGRGVWLSNSYLPPFYLFSTPCLRPRSPGLIIHLSSWNAERHRPWGKNFPYLLLYSSVHRHFLTYCRFCSVLHIHAKGHKICQQTTCALDRAGTSPKCRWTRDIRANDWSGSLSVTLIGYGNPNPILQSCWPKWEPSRDIRRMIVCWFPSMPRWYRRGWCRRLWRIRKEVKDKFEFGQVPDWVPPIEMR